MVTKSLSVRMQSLRSKKSGVPFTPHEYQKRAIAHLLQHPRAGLFLDPGLGKTAITLAAYDILREQGMVDSMLVIAPLRVAHSVWPAELQHWQALPHPS